MDGFLVQVCVVGDPKMHLFRFPVSELRIGRHDNNEVILPHESVEERHARIVKKDDRYILVDLKSEYGTRLNNQEIKAPTIIGEHDRIRIGDYELAILLQEPAQSLIEIDFLRAIEARPMEDDTRSVYADWLEEEGRHDEAEYLRAQITIKRTPPEHPHFKQLSDRITNLGRAFGSAWRRTVARPVIENCELRFELVCPKRWDSLEPTASPAQRHCNACQRIVYHASSVPEARRLAMAGACVAVDVEPSQRYAGDILEARRANYVGRMAY